MRGGCFSRQCEWPWLPWEDDWVWDCPLPLSSPEDSVIVCCGRGSDRRMVSTTTWLWPFSEPTVVQKAVFKPWYLQGKDLMCAKRALQVRANTKECFLIALLTFPLHWAPANRHQLWLVEEAGRRSIRFFISPGSEGWKVVVERTYWWIISESVNQQPDSRVWVWVLGDPRYKGNY